MVVLRQETLSPAEEFTICELSASKKGEERTSRERSVQRTPRERKMPKVKLIDKAIGNPVKTAKKVEPTSAGRRSDHCKMLGHT